MIDRIEKVALSRPLVPEKDKLAVERRIFPSEVTFSCLITPDTSLRMRIPVRKLMLLSG